MVNDKFWKKLITVDHVSRCVKREERNDAAQQFSLRSSMDKGLDKKKRWITFWAEVENLLF